MVINENLA